MMLRFVTASREQPRADAAHLARVGAGEEMITYVTDRPGHDLRYSVDTSKITALGWSPAYSFDEALDRTVAWYREHSWWWRPLKADTMASRSA